MEDLREHIAFGASPRGPIGMVQAAQALALLRGRRHVVPDDVRHLAPDVLRHRIALSYDALAEGVTAQDIVERVLEAVDAPQRASVLHDSAEAA
jgi:MoxR-like ATPase